MATILTITFNPLGGVSTLLTYGDSTNPNVDGGYSLQSNDAFGSLGDANFYGSEEMRSIYTLFGGSVLIVEFSTPNLGQSFFDTIVTSVGTYDTASASYTASQVGVGTPTPFSRWSWGVSPVTAFPISGSETITITGANE